jgi:hypothetical protein
MAVEVTPIGEWFAVVSGGAPVRTPMGTPVVSRHRPLAEEVAADVARYGVDPTAKTTLFSLQASYLDFGLRVKREVLEENTAAIWPDDLFVRRPADPELAVTLEALWGKPELDRPAFRGALRGATLRQLMATMTAGQVLRSAYLGWIAVTTDRDLVPLTLGACGRHFSAIRARAERGTGTIDGGGTVRHEPTEMDGAYCAGVCCATGGGPDEAFPARCALHPLLDKLRRWAAFPEEVEKG